MADTESVPVVRGVITIEQEAVFPVPVSVHDPVGEKAIVPVGVALLDWSTSRTVAVQLVARLTTTLEGEQDTLVIVGDGRTTGFIVNGIVTVVAYVELVIVTTILYVPGVIVLVTVTAVAFVDPAPTWTLAGLKPT